MGASCRRFAWTQTSIGLANVSAGYAPQRVPVKALRLYAAKARHKGSADRPLTAARLASSKAVTYGRKTGFRLPKPWGKRERASAKRAGLVERVAIRAAAGSIWASWETKRWPRSQWAAASRALVDAPFSRS